MARRLIQRVLHWLRQLLGLRTIKQQRPHPPQPHHQLPTAELNQPQIPTYSPPQRPAADPLGHQSVHHQPPQPTHQPTVNSSNTPPVSQPSDSAQERPRAPLNPGSHHATNTSRFRVRLSDYQYPPNTAIQNLSNQLADPQTPAPNIPKLPTPDLPRAEETTIAKGDPATSAPPAQEPPQTLNFLQRDVRESSPKDDNTIQQTPPPLPQQSPHLPPEQNNSLFASPIAPPEAPAQPTDQDPNSITKQGKVKLLFKIKKNNHHGYIAPNDGSKDIIFHQKYIGNDIFAQLERGMEVEVTAHLTAGKAYADHIRIL